MKHIIENDRLLVEVAEKGAELSRIYDKRNAREVLFNADPAWWASHAPVLFPIVGRLKDGKYTHEGVTYEMTPHGIARHLPFAKEKGASSYVWLQLHSDEATRRSYPFDFRFHVGHTLTEDTLRVSWRVSNESHVVMPFSIGAHPAFLCPVNKGEALSDCSIDFHTTGPLSYRLINAQTGLVQPQPHDLVLSSERAKLNDRFFDRDVYIFNEFQVSEISLVGKNGRPYLLVRFPGFPDVGVWAKPGGAPFVCIEPWFGHADEQGTTGVLTQKAGIRMLQPGASFEASYDIVVL